MLVLSIWNHRITHKPSFLAAYIFNNHGAPIIYSLPLKIFLSMSRSTPVILSLKSLHPTTTVVSNILVSNFSLSQSFYTPPPKILIWIYYHPTKTTVSCCFWPQNSLNSLSWQLKGRLWKTFNCHATILYPNFVQNHQPAKWFYSQATEHVVYTPVSTILLHHPPAYLTSQFPSSPFS